MSYNKNVLKQHLLNLLALLACMKIIWIYIPLDSIAHHVTLNKILKLSLKWALLAQNGLNLVKHQQNSTGGALATRTTIIQTEFRHAAVINSQMYRFPKISPSQRRANYIVATVESTNNSGTDVETLERKAYVCRLHFACKFQGKRVKMPTGYMVHPVSFPFDKHVKEVRIFS